MPIILRLDVEMQKKRFGVSELAEKIGISSVALSKIKNSKARAVRFSTLDLLCDALGCEPGDIIKKVSAEEAVALFGESYLDDEKKGDGS